MRRSPFQFDQTRLPTLQGQRRYQGSSSFQCDRAVRTEWQTLPQHAVLVNLVRGAQGSYLLEPARCAIVHQTGHQ